MWSLDEELRAMTTCSKKDKLLLMKVASFKVRPDEPVFLVRSEPARSTKCSLELMTLSVDSTLDLDSIWMVNTVWDLDDLWFNWCAATVLASSPSNKQFKASSSESHTTILAFLITTPPLASSSILRVEADYSWVGTGESKSNIISLYISM